MWKWVAVVAVTMAVAAIEARYRWEDWLGMHRYVSTPVFLRPGATVATWWLNTEIVAVNGRPVRGAADVWRTMVGEEDRALTVQVRLAGGRVKEVTPLRGHCTCGISSDATILWAAIVPALTLAAAGLAMVWLRPGEPRAWMLLGLFLGIGQADLLPTDLADFLHGAEPMAWDDWMRVPTVAYRAFLRIAWPGFALAAAGVGRAWPLMALGVLQAVLMVGWSENAAATAGLWALRGNFETELALVALALSTARAGWWWAAVWAGTAVLFYRVVPAEARYWWESYSDNTRRLAFGMPGFRSRPEFLVAGAALALLAAGGRRGWLVAVACLPVIYVTAANEFIIWHWDYVGECALALGMAGAAVLLRDAHREISRDRGR